MIPIFLAALLTLAQAAPVPPAPPLPPVPPAAPAPPEAPIPPVPVWEEVPEVSGYLGLVPADVPRGEVKRLGLKTEAGALVRRVIEQGPAAEAGIMEGDVILTFGEVPVTSAAQLRRLVRETPAGRRTAVELVRNGKRMRLEVTLVAAEAVGRVVSRPDRYLEYPDHRPLRIIIEKELEGSQEELERAREEVDRASEAMERALEGADLDRKEFEIRLRDADGRLKELKRITLDPDHPLFWLEGDPDGDRFNFRLGGDAKPRLGVGLQDLTPQLAEYFGLKGAGGVLISSVTEGSAAAMAGLKAGDVILAVAGNRVEDAVSVRRLVTQAEAGPLEVKVLRDRKPTTFHPVLEIKEERVIVREKHAKDRLKDLRKEGKVIVKAVEPGSPAL